MEAWDKKSCGMLVGGIVVVLLLVSWVWLAVDCDTFPAWCSPPEAAIFNTHS